MRSRQNAMQGFQSGRQIDGSLMKQQSKGAALIITLLLLVLLSAASLAMVLLVSSDSMINGYYQNYRGSFYAADSGLNIVVEGLKQSIATSANLATNPPLSTATIPAPVLASYALYQNGYYTIGDPGSWNEQFTMVANQATASNPTGAVLQGPQPLAGQPYCTQSPLDPVHPNDNVTCDFIYPYTVTVKGQSSGSEGEEITESGQIHYHTFSGNQASSTPPSFSKWGAFINHFGDCQGPLVQGTMTGPFFTNGQWNFDNSSSPGYTFTDPVGQSGANVSWWKNNNCTDSPSAPRGYKTPNFQGGLQLSQNPVTPPTNSYSQAQAVVDGAGLPPCTSSPCPTYSGPNTTEMNNTLKQVTGSAYNSGAPSTGVYFPYYTSGTSPSGAPCSSATPCFGSSVAAGGSGYGGGFYVQGNASVALSATTGCSNASCGGNDPTQTYTITQGSTVTTIVVDNSNGTTVVSSGGTTQVYQGVPTQVDPNSIQPGMPGQPTPPQTDPSGNAVNPTLVYVNGQITGLTGPHASNGNSLPAIQNNTGITIAASNNISITGNLEYAQSPVSVPADTLSSSTDAGVLGIYTTGNINLNPDPQDRNQNLTVDASLAAIGSGTSGFATPGRSINTWTIVGGRAEDQAHGVYINQGNTFYDRRFANNFGPPWFPTSVPQAGQVAIPSSSTMTVTRTWWAELSR